MGEVFRGCALKRTLTLDTTETLLNLSTSTTVAITILEWGIAFGGASAADAPIQVQVGRTTTTGTGTTFTPVTEGGSNATATATIRNIITTPATFPTRSLFDEAIHPNGGGKTYVFPDNFLRVPISSHIGIQIVTPNPAISAYAWFRWMEG